MGVSSYYAVKLLYVYDLSERNLQVTNITINIHPSHAYYFTTTTTRKLNMYDMKP